MDQYHLHTDEYLLELLSSDDQHAFNQLYERYWKKLLVRAKILLGSEEDAEEAVHDIFVTVWKKRMSIKIKLRFHTYIAAMLQYDCFKILAERKRKRITVASAELKETADHHTQQYLDFESLRHELENAVRALPEKCQLVFRLSRENGLSDKQIAEELDISVNTVRTHMHRALTQLKSSLNSFFLL